MKREANAKRSTDLLIDGVEGVGACLNYIIRTELRYTLYVGTKRAVESSRAEIERYIRARKAHAGTMPYHPIWRKTEMIIPSTSSIAVGDGM